MITRRKALVLCIAPLCVAAMSSLDARAEQDPRARPRLEIVMLYAKSDASSKTVRMGPGVPQLPQLSQAPFSAYNTFTLEGQATLTLAEPKPDDPWKGKPSATYALANGKPMRVAAIEQLPDRRWHMGATIGKDSPDVVRWDAPVGETVFIAGQSYKDGILVVGLTLRQ
jgi:hypothetical protein